jgi:Secretion system C-terminal sorting domain
MKSIFRCTVFILLMTQSIFAQQVLQSASKYNFDAASGSMQIADSAQYSFSGNRYRPLKNSIMLDSMSYIADSVIQLVVPQFQYVNKIENTFNAQNKILSRAYYDKSNLNWFWKKLNKVEYNYDTAGNKIRQTNFNGSTVTQNDFFVIDQFDWEFNIDKLTTMTKYSKYNYAASSWETFDSSSFYYTFANLQQGSEYHNFGSGLVYTAQYATSSVLGFWSSTVRLSIPTLDSTSKTTTNFLGVDEDSITSSTFISAGNWYHSGAVRSKYYPGTKNAFSRYFYTGSGAFSIIQEKYETEFAGIYPNYDYTRPIYFLEDHPGQYKRETTTTYYNATAPLAAEVKTVIWNQAGTAVYATNTDSLFYDVNNNLILRKGFSDVVGGYDIYNKVDYEYTADNQLKKETLRFYDTTAGAYVQKWSAYTYNYYYGGAQPNAITNAHSSDIKIYPNPATDKIVIECAGINATTDIEIYDALGCKMPLRATVLQEGSATINLAKLSCGTYFVQFISGGIIHCKQIVKL